MTLNNPGLGKFNMKAARTTRLITGAYAPLADTLRLYTVSDVSNAIKTGDEVMVAGSGLPWVDTPGGMLSNTGHKVIGTSTTSITITRPVVKDKKNLTLALPSYLVKNYDKGTDTRVVGSVGYSESTQAFGETRPLGTMFTWDTTLGSSTYMCADQRRAKKMLDQFWSNAEVQRNYKLSKFLYQSNWSDYGPQGDFAKDKWVNATMCIIHGSSRWNKGCVTGGTTACEQYTAFTKTDLDDLEGGLFQIVPRYHKGYAGYLGGFGDNPLWSQQLPSEMDDADLPLSWFNSEFAIRAGIWMMWRRIVRGSFRDDPTGATANPFRWMPAAQWSGTAWTNTATQNCWGSGCSGCGSTRAYGTKNC